MRSAVVSSLILIVENVVSWVEFLALVCEYLSGSNDHGEFKPEI